MKKMYGILYDLFLCMDIQFTGIKIKKIIWGYKWNKHTVSNNK